MKVIHSRPWGCSYPQRQSRVPQCIFSPAWLLLRPIGLGDVNSTSRQGRTRSPRGRTFEDVLVPAERPSRCAREGYVQRATPVGDRRVRHVLG